MNASSAAVYAEVQALRTLLAGVSPIVARAAEHHLAEILAETEVLEEAATKLAYELEAATTDF